MRCNQARFVRLFHGLLNRGVYLPPSAFETAFLSLAHDDGVLDQTLAAFAGCLADL
jgi:glutamate-1-semialdehyde 2,1-aminomutase